MYEHVVASEFEQSFFFHTEREQSRMDRHKSSHHFSITHIVTTLIKSNFARLTMNHEAHIYPRERERDLLFFLYIIVFWAVCLVCWNIYVFECLSKFFPVALQMYRTVKTTDKPAASSGNSYCFVFRFLCFFAALSFSSPLRCSFTIAFLLHPFGKFSI